VNSPKSDGLWVLDFKDFHLVDIALVGKQEQVHFILAFDLLDDLVIFLRLEITRATQRSQRDFLDVTMVRQENPELEVLDQFMVGDAFDIVRVDQGRPAFSAMLFCHSLELLDDFPVDFLLVAQQNLPGLLFPRSEP